MKRFAGVTCGILAVLLIVSCEKQQLTQKPNILLICVDDLRPELKSFGVNYISSPHIDEFANSGASFRNHFVNAPSCGPSRFTLLTGRHR